MATTDVSPAPSAPAPPAPSGPPPATSAPGGFNAKLDSMIDRIAGEPSPPETPDTLVDDGPEPAAPPEVVIGEQPPLDEPEPTDPAAEAAPPAEVAEDVEYLKEIQPDKVEGGKYYTTKAKFERLQAADKAMQALREIDPGITTDAIKEMYGRSLELDRMLSDYWSGDPQRVSEVADAFTGADAQGRPTQNPAAVTAFIDSAMANAAKYYPAAFQRVKQKILADLTQEAYQKYAQTRNEADKTLAWNLDYMLRNDYRRDIDQAAGQQADPVAAERAALARERQSYEFRKHQDRQAEITQAVNAAEADAKSAVDQAVEAALSVIPAKVREQKPTDYKHAVRDLRESFEEATKANENYTKPYNVLLSQLRANPTAEARSALVAHVKRWADWTVGRQKSEVVSRFSNGVVRQAAEANAKQEKLQERREPGGSNGTPVQRATLSQKLRDPKTGYAKGMDMYFDVLSRR